MMVIIYQMICLAFYKILHTSIQGFSWHSACESNCIMVTIVTIVCKERISIFAIYREILFMITNRETWLLIILLESFSKLIIKIYRLEMFRL